MVHPVCRGIAHSFVLPREYRHTDSRFAVLSFILLIFSRKIFGKTLRIKPVATNADSLIGERAVVTEDINNIEGRGAAKVRGLEWSARSADGENIEAGTVVLVIGIEGVKLICKKDKSDKN